MNLVLRATVPLLALLTAACGDMDASSTIPTDRIYARFVADTRADGTTRVTADFLEDEDLFYYEGVYLDGGDTLVFRSATDQVALPGGASSYVAELLSEVTENTRFEFDLQRPAHVDAPNSYGTLPAPMDIFLPESGAEYSLDGDELALAWRWGGTTDDMQVRLDARCVAPRDSDHLDRTITRDIPGDPGAYALQLSDAFPAECSRYEATLSLYRAREGTLDPAYAPNEDECEENDSCRYLGYVVIRQVRSVPIVLKR
jgi:hypothetical protein